MHIFPNAHWTQNKIDHERTLGRVSWLSLFITFLVVWSVFYQQNGPHHVRRYEKQCQERISWLCSISFDVPCAFRRMWIGVFYLLVHCTGKFAPKLGSKIRHFYLTSGVYGQINELIIIRNEWLTFIVVWNKEFSQSKIGIYCLNECQSQHWMCRVNR